MEFLLDQYRSTKTDWSRLNLHWTGYGLALVPKVVLTLLFTMSVVWYCRARYSCTIVWRTTFRIIVDTWNRVMISNSVARMLVMGVWRKATVLRMWETAPVKCRTHLVAPLPTACLMVINVYNGFVKLEPVRKENGRGIVWTRFVWLIDWLIELSFCIPPDTKICENCSQA